MMIKMQFHVWPPPFYLPHFRQRQSSKATSVCAKLRITNLIREEKPSFIPDLPQCGRFLLPDSLKTCISVGRIVGFVSAVFGRRQRVSLRVVPFAETQIEARP